MMDEEKIKEVVEAVTRGVTSSISLDAAKRLAAKVEAKAKEIGVNAVVAISNTGARPILVECMDDAFIASYSVALNKAYTVVALKMSTIELKPLAQPGASLYGIQYTNDSKIVVFGGGDTLKHNGRIIGGLGVSGGTEEQDTYLSAYGASIVEQIL